jgi:hypothetical protein
VEDVFLQHPVDMTADILAEARVDLVQHILAVIEGPHLAHGLVADAGDHSADLVQHRVDRAPLGVPVLLRERQLVADIVAVPALIDIGHEVSGALLMRHVVDAGADIDDRLEHRMAGDILHALAIDPDRPPVPDRFPVFLARSQSHARRLSMLSVPGWAPMDDSNRIAELEERLQNPNTDRGAEEPS